MDYGPHGTRPTQGRAILGVLRRGTCRSLLVVAGFCKGLRSEDVLRFETMVHCPWCPVAARAGKFWYRWPGIEVVKHIYREAGK